MPDPTGGFIRYELMTTDREGAKAFYEPVVGWSIRGVEPQGAAFALVGDK